MGGVKIRGWVLGVAAAGLTAAGVTAVVVSTSAVGDTENCVTHAEYNQTDVFMTPAGVESIYDVNGWFIDTDNPDNFARGYRTCWSPPCADPDGRKVVVWYDQAEPNYTLRWDVRDC